MQIKLIKRVPYEGGGHFTLPGYGAHLFTNLADGGVAVLVPHYDHEIAGYWTFEQKKGRARRPAS